MNKISSRVDDILYYWFGSLPDPAFFPADKAKLWFQGGPDVDSEIKSEFYEDLRLAAIGSRDDWMQSPQGALALILLLDQFSRNIYRNKPSMFAFDTKALVIAMHAIENGMDEALYPVQRFFLYLPLEHTEDLALQRKCVALFESLLQSGPSTLQEQLQSGVDYAKQHCAIIERFGRFPHRNAILGRKSTPEEIEFLKQPNSSF